MNGFQTLARDWKKLKPHYTGSTASWLHGATSSAKLKYLVVATFVAVSFAYLLLYTSSSSFEQWKNVRLSGKHGDRPPENGDWTTAKHPIDDLIVSARAGYNRALGKQSFDVDSAARQYRQRRGRHPPPGFDKWFAYAQNKSGIVVEDFFDRIYHDLNPFWALEPRLLRYQSYAGDFVISVREGNATYKTDDGKRVPWIQLWYGLIEELAGDLPDVDLPINMMDESRLIVPWEEINEYMGVSMASRNITPVATTITNYTGLLKFDMEEMDLHYDPQWTRAQYWDLARLGCHPNSSAYDTPPWSPLEESTPFPKDSLTYALEGFVSNWTAAKDFCTQPHLRGLHGTFVEPISISTSHHLIPLFGGSKLQVNNEILLPPATYLNPDPMYSGGDAHGPPWDSKKDNAVWRGVGSGGRNKRESWSHFQRHRFVQMMNGSRVLAVETTRIRAETFDLPSWDEYSLTATRNGYLGDWVSAITDVAFVDLLCFPNAHRPGCDYTDPFFQTADGIPMSAMYESKFLPDIDGNSFSGRYRSFLRSTSVPVKATVYNEWHDDRLFPWVHFVPMDNTFKDIYGILDYFMGFQGVGAHDDMAARIAQEGKEWAEKVLRREDMAIYTYRLLLEFARICDDNRLVMGWIGDLEKGLIQM